MSLLLNRETIQGLLNMEDTIRILEQAFGELAEGTSIMPPRTAVSDPDVLAANDLFIGVLYRDGQDHLRGVHVRDGDTADRRLRWLDHRAVNYERSARGQGSCTRNKTVA